MSLAGKVALITGAARRIGAEIAHTLHAAQMNVIIHYHHSEHDALLLKTELNRKRSHSAEIIQADLANAENGPKLITNAVNVWQRLDVLINNASQFKRSDLVSLKSAEWDALLNTNLKAPFFLAQAAFGALKASEGCIINITDTNAQQSLPDYGIYCLSKSGLNALTKILAKAFGPKVRVNAVAPGAIAWPEGDNALDSLQQQKIINKTTLKRSGYCADIAKTVLFLVRDADFITGQIIPVDGGRS